ncbi:SLAIN motif-containing protein 1-like isoform X2 [Thunnus albacares]|uniref:SLAIN motif-containing protein 1-like isoform X2 n=1 Tax=Thunnus maccoyii TaxID=8240 RepID=UPI001C4CCA84|nr:SLAIN motif-containing protein 1-like isoform X2 [Thunnus maccoyii]XP_044201109.1 SLAIN motif-containing protein 1-like isoform X2 [Thunnus albacares]
MEAAVLNPAIMTEVDCNSNTLNAELEVKKLQELVRKLERQNEQLRTRASGCAGGPHVLPIPPACVGGYCLPSPPPTLLCQTSLGSFALPPEEPFDYLHRHTAGDGEAAAGEAEDASEPSVLDELELLDLDSLCCSEESDESWLYVSSRATESSDDSLTPLQWCRQVLDCPKSEVEAARRSLSLRLEQVSRWRSSLSSPSPSSSSSSPGPPLSRVAGVSPISASPSAKPCSTPQSSERHAPSLSSPLHPILHRTLSPVGKELSPVAERTPTFLSHLANRNRSLRRSALSPQSSMDSDLGASEAEDDSIALGYKLQDLTDVQVMARLQEESLRQDYASTTSILANRRSQSFTFQLSQLSAGPDLEEEDEEDDEDYGLLPPPQPRLTRLPHSHTFSSIRDWRRSTSSLSTPPSTPSTPPYPSAGFAFQPQAHTQLQGLGLGSPCTAELQGFRPGSDKLRRSMPNLVRAPSMPSVPIPTNPSASPLLRNSQSFDSSSGLARLQSSIPSPGQLQNRVQSVGNFSSLSRQPLKATAYVSPTIKGSATMPTSTSLQSLNCSSGSNSGIPMLSKLPGGGATPTSTPTTPRSSLPRPASFIGTPSSTPRSKAAQPARSLLTPPKSLSTLSALRDSTWRDGCY